MGASTRAHSRLGVDDCSGAFAEFARAPSVSEIAVKVNLPVDQVGVIVADLHAHDLLVMDDSATTIVCAYPFAGYPTDHCVELHGRMLHAVCGIDALGVAGCFRPIRPSSQRAVSVGM